MTEPAATAAARPRYHHGDLRAALVEAAERLLAERGPEGFTLRECARRLGVSNAAPAHHFKDVNALLSEVAAVGFERLRAAMLEARAAAGPDPAARLAAIGRAYIATAVAEPATFRLMFHSQRRDPALPRLRQAGQGAYGVLEATLGELVGTPAGLAEVQLAWATVHGFAVLLIEGRLGGDARFGPPESWPAHADALLAGLLRSLAR
jgi:AcrR family transcriptional regulator